MGSFQKCRSDQESLVINRTTIDVVAMVSRQTYRALCVITAASQINYDNDMMITITYIIYLG